jgi:hypothetical protein
MKGKFWAGICVLRSTISGDAKAAVLHPDTAIPAGWLMFWRLGRFLSPAPSVDEGSEYHAGGYPGPSATSSLVLTRLADRRWLCLGRGSLLSIGYILSKLSVFLVCLPIECWRSREQAKVVGTVAEVESDCSPLFPTHPGRYSTMSPTRDGQKLVSEVKAIWCG